MATATRAKKDPPKGKTKPVSQAPIDAEASDIPRLLKAADVAKQLRIAYTTLKSMITSGRFPKRDIAIGNKHLWKASTVKAWIDENCGK